MSVRLSVMKQGKSGSSSLSRSLAASRLGRATKKAMKRASALIAPSMARSGGFSFRAVGGKELNFVDTTVAVNVNTTGSVTLLNGMAQGTTASTRIGRRIQMKSIEFKLFVQADSTALTNVTRYAIVLDKQSNGAAPAFTDIYDAAAPTALRNISNKARFWVLYDSGLQVCIGNSATAAQGTDNTIRPLELYKRINIPVQYNAGSAGTVGDIQTNGLFFVAIGNIAAGTADATVAGYIRVRYDDS